MKRDEPTSTGVTRTLHLPGEEPAGSEPGRPSGVLELPDRYVDLGVLGAGGIGEVRRVRDRVVDATLAMKILHRVPTAEARARFYAEARITARLRHPGIVAVQDLGQLGDGRPWFTMEEVGGRTFQAVLRDGSGGQRRATEILSRVCEAVAYAHAQGVVHRDLKPDNVLVGDFGEVRVMDWGLARVFARPETAPGASESVHSAPGAPSAAGEGTAVGVVMGTPGFMPPEQAMGLGAGVGPQADVYALGCMLYTILAGFRAFAALSGSAAVAATLRGPPAPIDEVAPGAPPALRALCAACMARLPEERPAHGGVVAEALRAWLEGARREDEGRALVERASAHAPEVSRLLGLAAELDAAGAAHLDGLPAFASVEEKLPGWRLLDQAAEARSAATRAEEEVHRDLRAALGHAPDLRAAHEALADLYRTRLLRAEALGQHLAAADAESMLRAHDRGTHARWLQGDGAITLVTEPPGAVVDLYRYVLRDRRLVEEHVCTLGETPLFEVTVPRGSYVLRVSHPERVEVAYPVRLGRLEHWSGVRPGGETPTVVRLPLTLAEDERYVAPGWFQSGGDPDALDALPARRLWVDGFVMKRDPVTNAEYRAYLEALARDGADLTPALPRGLTEADTPFVWAGGEVRLGTSEGRPLRAHEPVVFVTPEQADAYAGWYAVRDGRPWRLPHDQEREKAGRGVDGRAFPWGDTFEPNWTRMQSSVPGVPGRADVGTPPGDVGPYGLRGMAGNVRDVCHNAYRRAGPAPESALVTIEPAPAGAPFRMVRGGSWTGTERQCRLATRVAAPPGASYSVMGLRLVRTW